VLGHTPNCTVPFVVGQPGKGNVEQAVSLQSGPSSLLVTPHSSGDDGMAVMDQVLTLYTGTEPVHRVSARRKGAGLFAHGKEHGTTDREQLNSQVMQSCFETHPVGAVQGGCSG
jgi:predicted component of type VI protein secretion system